MAEHKIDLAEWLESLSFAVQAEPKEGTIKAYLEALENWQLTNDQWKELRRRAVVRHRFPRILPMISELYEIAGEIRLEASTAAGTRHAEEIRRGDSVPCPADLRPVFEGLRKI